MSKFSRNVYITMARVIATVHSDQNFEDLVDQFVVIFQDDNKNFDEKRFREAANKLRNENE